MTSEPDSKPGRRPPTIELKATEVDTPAPTAPSGGAAPADEPAPKADAPTPTRIGAASGGPANRRRFRGPAEVPRRERRSRGDRRWPRSLPDFGSTGIRAVAPAPRHRDAAIGGAGGAMTARLDKIRTAAQPDAAAGARLAAAEAQTKSLGDELAALSRRLDDIAATSQGAAKQRRAAPSRQAQPTTSQTAVQKQRHRCAGEPDRGAGKRGQGAVRRRRAPGVRRR